MPHVVRSRRWAALLTVLALAVAACGGAQETGSTDTAAETPADTAAETPAGTGSATATAPSTEDAAAGEIATDVGVTEEPCPDAVNQDNGCIYLGILSDLTVGPFAALAVPIVAGQEAFWARVNEGGGIAGAYDVNISEYTRDNEYNPQVHVDQYRQIEPNILALAQSLGTPPTLAAYDLYVQDDVLAAPASWWSGWNFPETGANVIESGQPYCIESMNGMDYYAEEFGMPETVMAVGYPGDYGGDGAAGVELWAEANGVEFAGFTQTAPNAVAGNQDAAVQAILSSGAQAVQIGTGPAEMAEIVGNAVAGGFEGKFLGSVPTFNPALLGSPAAEALIASYIHVGPWGSFGADSAAHDAMAEALGGEPPENDGFTYGWIWSYPLQALLEQAAANGDLTRAGLISTLESGLEVDYEGALPAVTYGGEPADTVSRSAVISMPDPEAPVGLTTVIADFVGPTAEAFEFTEACVTVEG